MWSNIYILYLLVTSNSKTYSFWLSFIIIEKL